jgi:hypothetical protein
LLSSHGSVLGVPWHEPNGWQTSVLVQGLKSSQGAKFGTAKQPITDEQKSSVQGLKSLQMRGTPPTQAPPLHCCPSVQGSLPSHTLVSSGVLEHPVTASQASSVQAL